MKIFVTGHRGYIGVHLVDILKKKGHSIVGCDIGLFDGCALEPFTLPDLEITKDIRGLTVDELRGCDCVAHLAAISNDPMGELDPDVTRSVNRDGSIHVAKVAKEAGVKRFLFSGSCSVYGKGQQSDLDETAPLRPLSTYAISKVEAESEISKMADADFSPTFLRNATAYGYSPMLRLDLVANNLLACAFTRGDIRIKSDGKPWRPLIHCRDIARAFLHFMEAPVNKIHNNRVNVGGNAENYQVRQVGDIVKNLVPNSKIVYTGEIGVDPRDYRVRFDLLNRLFPDFRLQYNLLEGMVELQQKFTTYGLSLADFEGDRFVRLRTLRKRINLLTV